MKQNGVNGYLNIYNAVYQPDSTLMTAEKLLMLEEATCKDKMYKNMAKIGKEKKERKMA